MREFSTPLSIAIPTTGNLTDDVVANARGAGSTAVFSRNAGDGWVDVTAAEFHDEVWERTGIAPERTIFGGFSMGSVMSYSLGLGADRPAPAGILAFSGFIPVVDDWQPDLAKRPAVFIANGRQDPVMEVGFARRANELLVAGGLNVEYHESDAAHYIDPAHVPAAIDFVGRTLVGTGTPR